MSGILGPIVTTYPDPVGSSTVIALPTGSPAISLVGPHNGVLSQAGVILKTDGELWYREFQNPDYQAPGNFWADPGTGFSSGDYEARMVPDGGFGGIMNGAGSPDDSVWVNLGSERLWFIEEFVSGLRSYEGTLEIGLTGTSTAIASASVLLIADSVVA